MSRTAYAIALMTLGAQALAQYLIHTEPQLADVLQTIKSNLSLIFFLFAFAGSSLDRRRAGHQFREPSPRYSGVAIIVITGVTAFIAVGLGNYLYGLLIAVGTMVAAVAVWRFATAHAGEIGESRFPMQSPR